jgi:hypothetical protein
MKKIWSFNTRRSMKEIYEKYWEGVGKASDRKKTILFE